MARSYLIFGDIEGKLEVLRVECTRCDRKGRYSVAKLIEKHGRSLRLVLALPPAVPVNCINGVALKFQEET